VPLRSARETWHALDAPYEIARTRVLAGEACRALGDAEAAALELEAARGIFERLGAKPDLERLGAQPTPAAHGRIATLLPRETARSSWPSSLKSAAATWLGDEPTEYVAALGKPPDPSLSSTCTPSAAVAAMSSLEFASKLPTATPFAVAPSEMLGPTLRGPELDP
jgi:hypothetical protein